MGDARLALPNSGSAELQEETKAKLSVSSDFLKLSHREASSGQLHPDAAQWFFGMGLRGTLKSL